MSKMKEYGIKYYYCFESCAPIRCEDGRGLPRRNKREEKRFLAQPAKDPICNECDGTGQDFDSEVCPECDGLTYQEGEQSQWDYKRGLIAS